MPDTNRFQVLARPKMVHRATVGPGLDYVEFFASHEAEDLRIWRMAAHDLAILFDIVETSELVADLICELHEGTSVTLPGDYSAAQLVLLGYRIPLGNHRGLRTFPATDMRNTLRKTLPTCPLGCCRSHGATPSPHITQHFLELQFTADGGHSRGGLNRVSSSSAGGGVDAAFGTFDSGGLLTNSVIPSGKRSKREAKVIVPQGCVERAQLGLEMLKTALFRDLTTPRRNPSHHLSERKLARWKEASKLTFRGFSQKHPVAQHYSTSLCG